MIIATTLWLLGSVLMYYAERENPDEGLPGKDKGEVLGLFWREAGIAVTFRGDQESSWWIHSARLTWNLRIYPRKGKIIFQTIIFRFYVNLGGCMLINFLVGDDMLGVAFSQDGYIVTSEDLNMQCNPGDHCLRGEGPTKVIWASCLLVCLFVCLFVCLWPCFLIGVLNGWTEARDILGPHDMTTLGAYWWSILGVITHSLTIY